MGSESGQTVPVLSPSVLSSELCGLTLWGVADVWSPQAAVFERALCLSGNHLTISQLLGLQATPRAPGCPPRPVLPDQSCMGAWDCRPLEGHLAARPTPSYQIRAAQTSPRAGDPSRPETERVCGAGVIMSSRGISAEHVHGARVVTWNPGLCLCRHVTIPDAHAGPHGRAAKGSDPGPRHPAWG